MAQVKGARRLTDPFAGEPSARALAFLADALQEAHALLMAMEPGLRAAGAETADRAAIDRALQSHDLLRQRLERLSAFAAAAPFLKDTAEAERLLRLDALVSAWRGEDAPDDPLVELF